MPSSHAAMDSIPKISLYGMGGLTNYRTGRSLTRQRSILVSLAGPAAGLLLGAIVWGITRIPMPELNPFGRLALFNLLIVNIFWSIFESFADPAPRRWLGDALARPHRQRTCGRSASPSDIHCRRGRRRCRRLVHWQHVHRDLCRLPRFHELPSTARNADADVPRYAALANHRVSVPRRVCDTETHPAKSGGHRGTRRP